jgi:hypothetical protein
MRNPNDSLREHRAGGEREERQSCDQGFYFDLHFVSAKHICSATLQECIGLSRIPTWGNPQVNADQTPRVSARPKEEELLLNLVSKLKPTGPRSEDTHSIQA